MPATLTAVQPNLPLTHQATAHPFRGPGVRMSSPLLGLCARQTRALLGIRLGTSAAWMLALIYAAMIMYLGVTTVDADFGAVALNAVRTISAVSGTLVLLSVSHNFARLDQQQGISIVASLRGYSFSQVERWRWAASVLVLTRVFLYPSLVAIVATLAMADSVKQVALRLMLAVLVLIYCFALAAVLATLGRWSARLAPGFARTFALAVLVLPHLAREVWPLVPSLPALFLYALEGMNKLEAGWS